MSTILDKIIIFARFGSEILTGQKCVFIVVIAGKPLLNGLLWLLMLKNSILWAMTRHLQSLLIALTMLFGHGPGPEVHQLR